MPSPLVSVVVPIYNLAPYLMRGVNSLINQTYRNLQVLLVDDHSTDDSAALIAQAAQTDSRIEPIYLPENRGVSAARNAGLAQARGLYVAFMDGDDWLAPGLIDRFAAALEEGPYDILVSPFYVDDPAPKPVPKRLLRSKVLSRRQFLSGMLAPVGYLRGYLWNKFYRRSVIESAHLQFDEQVALMEDELFNAQYALAASRFYYLGEPGYHHVVRADSTTQSLSVLAALPKQLTALWQIGALIRTSYQTGAVPEEPVRSER
ncbi:glycosyltransferase family 2 protein [Lacticaseibacillus hegangensis]|uniref:Glycosyltransferase family 2 protein n=1 Tax=Lacticaseibacillus hegangensis TaxID=2486010 RepID=A0ABW4CRZ3_9LACO|nr:glycosyltransferase family 2 protein [Lacticaseibacillus hegangensis]